MLVAAIAQSLGIKFEKGASGRFAPAPNAIEAADPFAIQALLGQSDVLPYAPPRRGLVIDPGGKA